MLGRTILTIAAITAAGCSPAQEPQPDAARELARPNILFLFADDQRADTIAAWEHELLRHGTQVLGEIPGVRLFGTAPEKAAVLSFVLADVHPHDIGTILDQEGIAVRSGHHCTQPLMDRFGIPATARASLAFYNTKEEIDALADGLRRVIEVFA